MKKRYLNEVLIFLLKYKYCLFIIKKNIIFIRCVVVCILSLVFKYIHAGIKTVNSPV